MNRCVFIIPYFGKFNNYFQLFLDSCGYNTDFDWLIFTDDKRDFKYPQNVTVYYTTFEKIRKLVEDKIELKIELSKPYKLCDYRPAYGYIFDEYIKEYEFWGHCDTDLIWGDISNFITNDKLDMYKRILDRGHFILYKNCLEMNQLFLIQNSETFIDYRYAFTTKYNCHFDEIFTWNHILDVCGLSYWTKPVFADINCNKYRFTLVYGNNKNSPQVFEWNRGKLFRYYIEENTVCKDEWCYIHLQKREMLKDKNVIGHYYIVPNKFESYKKDITIEYIVQNSQENFIYFPRRIQRIKEICQNIKNGALQFRWKKYLFRLGKK